MGGRAGDLFNSIHLKRLQGVQNGSAKTESCASIARVGTWAWGVTKSNFGGGRYVCAKVDSGHIALIEIKTWTKGDLPDRLTVTVALN